MKKTDPGLARAIEAAGGVRALAAKLGISHSVIVRWKRAPARHIIRIEEVTGVPSHELRPELYVNYFRIPRAEPAIGAPRRPRPRAKR
jgi:DNA-binding transcriptional regulator YdaS (Cro superfamily)